MIKAHINKSQSSFFDHMPAGIDEGGAKMVLYHRLSALVLWSKEPHLRADSIAEISKLAQRLERYTARSAGLRGSPAKAAKRYAHKGLSFLVENTAIFGAAAAGVLAGGAWDYSASGGVAGVTAATFPQSYGASIFNEIKRAGYDVKDPGDLTAALADPEFLTDLRGSARAHAGVSSAVVMVAGAFAGYVSSLIAKPIASTSAAVLRQSFSKVVSEIAEKSGLIEMGVRSGLDVAGKAVLNRAGQRAIQSGALQGAFLSAAVFAMVSTSVPTDPTREGQGQGGKPSYYRAAMYL